ncbi:uncharacterized protein DUF4333 [Sediminihabitans luteus]|uniref:Uncharacterized protein DUF4333 n=1 Tax=Sediminihabitans luteus TaxID=1138585 RepID=A0A2M9D0F8_9CELL|nr:DUF4333 domain-containing protein [Sediminihabitans luteus]PJJ77639.1 uncharacterized protein DUF4333 [Sediminihabitans luteus]GII98539.1 hypothetical protein Slu03_09170 [Sediminihabitans luteus]
MRPTTSTPARRATLALIVVGLAAGLGGCSVSVNKTVSGSTVANLAEDTFEEQIGQRPEVECPESLALTIDETMRCTLTDPSSGTEYGMTVLVQDDAADGSGLHFQVDDEAKGAGTTDDAADDADADAGSPTLSAGAVEASAADALEKSVGVRPEVECPSAIVLEAGQTLRCTVTDPNTETRFGMTTTVDEPAADGSGLSFQVDDVPLD